MSQLIDSGFDHEIHALGIKGDALALQEVQNVSLFLSASVMAHIDLLGGSHRNPHPAVDGCLLSNLRKNKTVMISLYSVKGELITV